MLDCFAKFVRFLVRTSAVAFNDFFSSRLCSIDVDRLRLVLGRGRYVAGWCWSKLPRWLLKWLFELRREFMLFVPLILECEL